MKKTLILFILVFFIITYSNKISYANNLIDITNLSSESIDVTFDSYKIVSGTGKKDTKVIIRQYTNLNELKKVSIRNIGFAGFFSEIFKLDLGDNKLVFDVTYKDEKERLEYDIIRKDERILEKLTNLSSIFIE